MNGEEKISADEKLRLARWSQLQRRVRRMEAQRHRALRKREAAAQIFGRRSKLIRLLAEMVSGASSVQRDSRATHIGVRVPDRFSVLDDAEAALRLISAVARQIRAAPKVRTVFIDQQALTKTDLGANALLDMLFMELTQEHRFNLRVRHVRVSGQLPDDERTDVFIRAIGIIHHLNVADKRLRGERREKVRVFEARRKHYEISSSARAQTLKDIKIQRFAEYVDECLGARHLELSPYGQKKICSCLGEIIANAEEHSGMAEWSVLGFVDLAVLPVCEFVVFNFGASISQTLEMLQPDSYTSKQIAPFLEKHRANGFLSSSWRQSDLLTVIALQGAVSSKNRIETDTRGNGTVDFIRFFQAMKSVCAPSDTTAKMVVLSGGTHIVFDGRYTIAETSPGRYEIAFNEANDLAEPPDRRNVHAMDGVYFPGTMISIRFPLSESVVREV